MGRLLCAVAVVVIYCGLCIGQTPSYNFPQKYQSLVTGWVSDGLSGHKKIVSTGWMFVDNTIPAMRVDEVWDLSTTVGTGLYDGLGVTADTHLYFESSSLFFYSTPEGPSCSNSTSGILPQVWSSSTYTDTVPFEGKLSYQFNQTYSNLPTTLYVDVETELPLAIYIGPISQRPTRFWDGSMVYFRSLFQVESFTASSVLFSAPNYC